MENLSYPEVRAEVEDYNAQASLLESFFDEAIVGVIEVSGQASTVCYDRERYLEIIEEIYGGGRQKAEEHFTFNVLGCLGEDSPVFLTRFGVND